MTISNSFLLHAMATMSRVLPVSYRRIFNGYGIYHQGNQFAIIVNDQLYFRADKNSRNLYITNRMAPFSPAAVKIGESNFFQLSDTLLSQPAELIFWMRIAIEAAQSSYLHGREEASADTPVQNLKLR